MNHQPAHFQVDLAAIEAQRFEFGADLGRQAVTQGFRKSESRKLAVQNRVAGRRIDRAFNREFFEKIAMG